MALLPQHVFVSYAREDIAFAQRITAALDAADLATWTDQSIPHGEQNYDHALRVALRSSLAIVVLASPASLKSGPVLGEVRVAEQLRIPVVPFWIAGESWEESAFIQLLAYQYIDARSPGLEAGISALATRLDAIVDAAIPRHEILHPAYVAAAAGIPKRLAASVTRGTRRLVVRPRAYVTVAAWLEAVTEELMSDYPDLHYGRGWLLHERDNVLAPIAWLEHIDAPVPIATYGSDWYTRTPGGCGVRSETNWEFIDVRAGARAAMLERAHSAPEDMVLMGVAAMDARAGTSALRAVTEESRLAYARLADIARARALHALEDGARFSLAHPSAVDERRYTFTRIIRVRRATHDEQPVLNGMVLAQEA